MNIVRRWLPASFQRTDFPPINLLQESTFSNWIVSSDKVIGGESEAKFEMIPSSSSSPHFHFSGNLSLKLAANDQGYIRSGFAGSRCPLKSSGDWEGYNTLQFKLKTDGRSYKLNISSTSWNPNDLYTVNTILFLTTSS